MEELRALSSLLSRRVCSFMSMTSYGSHYRVEGEVLGEHNVTFDCGVAELQARTGGNDSSAQCRHVDLIRVGTLQDIPVLNYVNTNIVLMVVSWVVPNTKLQPRMRRRLTWVLACKLGCHATLQQRSLYTLVDGIAGIHPFSLLSLSHKWVERGDTEHAE